MGNSPLNFAEPKTILKKKKFHLKKKKGEKKSNSLVVQLLEDSALSLLRNTFDP